MTTQTQIQIITQSIINWAGKNKLLIEDGKLYRLTYEKTPQSTSTYTYQFPKGWGDDTGKTKVFFRNPISPSDLDLVKTVELASGITVEFREFTYTHGSHIADRTFYQFSFVNGLCEGYRRSSPWDNPRLDFYNWRQNVKRRLSEINPPELKQNAHAVGA